MKKLSIFLASLLVCVLCVLPASAAGARLVDKADLLEASSYTVLLQKLDEISNRHDFDIVIVTVKSLEGQSAEAYADDYFDYGGYRANGILLLVSKGEERDFHMSTCGTGLTHFPDDALIYLEKKVLPCLSTNDFSTAFSIFAEQCDAILRNGSGVYKDPFAKLPMMVLIAFLIALVIGFICVSVMKGKLKSISTQARADAYVRPGSLAIANQRETFLYRTVTRQERQTSSSGGGSGSSSHKSSSGTTHGRRGGKF